VINIQEIYGIIYCAINIINDKRYIGQTIRDLNIRKREHISLSKADSEFAFHQALRKYSEENFEWIILDIANNQEELDEKECYWINYYDTYNQGGYNMSVGGQFNKKDYCDADDLSRMYGGKEFLVYDLEGNYIKNTFSQTEFAEEIGVCVQTVNNVLKGIKSSTNDFVLFFNDGKLSLIIENDLINDDDIPSFVLYIKFLNACDSDNLEAK